MTLTEMCEIIVPDGLGTSAERIDQIRALFDGLDQSPFSHLVALGVGCILGSIAPTCEEYLTAYTITKGNLDRWAGEIIEDHNSLKAQITGGSGLLFEVVAIGLRMFENHYERIRHG